MPRHVAVSDNGLPNANSDRHRRNIANSFTPTIDFPVFHILGCALGSRPNACWGPNGVQFFRPSRSDFLYCIMSLQCFV